MTFKRRLPSQCRTDFEVFPLAMTTLVLLGLMLFTQGCSQRISFAGLDIGSEDKAGAVTSQSSSDDPNVNADNLASCRKGEAVTGIDAEGRPECRYIGPDGLAPKWSGHWTANEYACPAGFDLRSLHYDCECSNNATWTACFRKSIVARIVTLGASSATAFQCPNGQALRGFMPDGRAVCRSTADTVPAGMAVAPQWDGNWQGNNFSCRPGFALKTQHAECSGGCSNNANIMVCERTGAIDDIVPDTVVAKSAALRGKICAPGEFVVGFDLQGHVSCGKVETALPADAGFAALWDGDWGANRYSCPAGMRLDMLHNDSGSSNNANWYACY